MFVTTESELVVLDAKTGADEWSTPLPRTGETSPTVTSRHVYVGTDGSLVAIDRRSQSVAWERETDLSELSHSGPEVSGPPTVARDAVIVGTYDGSMNAFDATSGDLRWSETVTTLPNESETPSYGNTPFFDGPAAIADGRVYATNNNGILYAFDLETGERLWSVESVEGSFHGGPTVVDGVVYATSTGLAAVAASDGTVRWRYSQDPGSMKESPVVVDDSVYVASGESYGSLAITALDRQKRTVEWRTGSRPQNGFSAGPERLYVPLFGNLVAIDRATGEIAWEMETESVVSGPPALTDGGVIAADERGAVFGIGPAA